MEEIAPVLMIGSYLAFIGYEALRPARKLQKVSWWKLKGLLFFVVMAAFSTVLPLVWGDAMTKHALLDLSGLGTVAGAVVGYALFQLAAYWWHRTMHTLPFLWRWVHQMHHSAERIDIWGAMLFHPFDIAGFTVLASLVYSLVLGLSPGAIALAGTYGFFASLFQHTNVRTPRWLGYLIQRPEGHGVHHQRGVHGYNYSDFPLWDVVFGTFRNPAEWREQGGFYDGGSKRVGAMLIGRDISTPESNPMAPRPSYADPARAAA
jgi:sterol desaturase/sphingolipid hydroxylase (fatty acid hydroxylase superfamily)